VNKHKLERPAAGFTLIEVVVVMAVIAIALALIGVNFAADDKRLLRTEAEKLALLLEQAQDEATVTGRSIAWAPSGSQYGFLRMQGGNWVPMAGDALFHDRAFDSLVEIQSLRINDTEAKPGDRVIFSPSGINLPFDLTLGLRALRAVVSGDAAGHVSVSM
jgi:type II secretion system protein H